MLMRQNVARHQNCASANYSQPASQVFSFKQPAEDRCFFLHVRLFRLYCRSIQQVVKSRYVFSLFSLFAYKKGFLRSAACRCSDLVSHSVIEDCREGILQRQKTQADTNDFIDSHQRNTSAAEPAQRLHSRARGREVCHHASSFAISSDTEFQVCLCPRITFVHERLILLVEQHM